MQGRCALSATVGLDQDLHILIERYQKAQQAFHRELPEIAVQHLRDIGLTYAEQSGGLYLFQPASLQDSVDLEYQFSFDPMLFRIRYADVLKYIPTSDLVSLFAAHGSISLANSSASRKRCRISSMSLAGVARPVFDFFWNA